MDQLCELLNCHEPDEDKEEMDYEEFWRMITIKGKTHPFESGKTKSTSIRNPVLRFLYRAITQIIFARVDSGGVSNTELYMMRCLLNRRGFNLGVMVTNYFDHIIKRDGGIICCGGLITTIVEHLEVSTEGLNPDMGESFLTYEVLFSMECLKIDSNGQGFFIQSDGDNFPVPNPYLTKIEGWENQANWKLNGPIHQRIMQSTPMMGAFRKSNMPKTTPIYDPTTDPNFGVIQPLQEGGAGPSDVHGDAHESPEEEEEEVEDHRRRNRAQGRRPRPQPVHEFQQHVTTRLDEMYSYMQNMSQTWDGRWAEQQQWNDHNHQSWEMNNDWRTVEQQFWEN